MDAVPLRGLGRGDRLLRTPVQGGGRRGPTAFERACRGRRPARAVRDGLPLRRAAPGDGPGDGHNGPPAASAPGGNRLGDRRRPRGTKRHRARPDRRDRPEGQRQIPATRAAHAASDVLGTLADRLTTAGLAVPAAARESVASGMREVRAAVVVIVVMPAAATASDPGGAAPIAPWFALPLLLTAGCFGIARVEIHPYTRWASPTGQDLLRAVPVPRSPAPDDAQVLTALAVRSPSALPDPELRAALA